MEKLTYTKIYTEDGVLDSVFRSDGLSIPANPANADYQRYLNPEAEQSTPIVINETETI